MSPRPLLQPQLPLPESAPADTADRSSLAGSSVDPVPAGVVALPLPRPQLSPPPLLAQPRPPLRQPPQPSAGALPRRAELRSARAARVAAAGLLDLRWEAEAADLRGYDRPAVLRHAAPGAAPDGWHSPSEVCASLRRGDADEFVSYSPASSAQPGSPVVPGDGPSWRRGRDAAVLADSGYGAVYLSGAGVLAMPAGVVGLPPAFRRRRGERHVMMITSAAPSSSLTHFDDTSSVLRVIAGCKEVWLRAPIGRGAPDPSGPGSSWSAYDPFDVDSAPELRGWARVVVIPGSALFIPRLWWHCVSSSAGTVATSTCVIPASPMASAAHGGESHVRRRRRISPAEAGAVETARHVAVTERLAARGLTNEWLATVGRRRASGDKEVRYPTDLCGARRCHLRAAFVVCGDSRVRDVRALEPALWQGEGTLRFVLHVRGVVERTIGPGGLLVYDQRSDHWFAARWHAASASWLVIDDGVEYLVPCSALGDRGAFPLALASRFEVFAVEPA
jgi:hypothetical protein